MLKPLRVLLVTLTFAMSLSFAAHAAEDQAAPNWFDPNTWMGMGNYPTAATPGNTQFNFAHPAGWSVFMNPATYPQFMNPATYAQFMSPQFYMQFANPNNWMAWMNPSAYAAFMNPATYMQMMNPAAYMQFMNPGMYMQPMNPANYQAFMNPATYMQWMNPAAYTMPDWQTGDAYNSGAFNFFDPMAWMNMAQMPMPAESAEK